MAKDSEVTVHRTGLFNLPPKKHSSGRHRSKHAIAKEQKGKIGIKSNSQPKFKHLKKLARKNRSLQIRSNKIEKISEQKRKEGQTPINITLISLDEAFTSRKLVETFNLADEDAIIHLNEKRQIFHLAVPRFKQRYTFFCPDTNSIISTLDFLRVSDILLILWPIETTNLQIAHSRLLDVIYAHGSPPTFNLVSTLPTSGKQRDSTRKSLEKLMAPWAKDSRIYDLQSGSPLQILRQISTTRKVRSNLQKLRPYLIAENVQIVKNEEDVDSCTLLVSGYLNGAPLNINGLVHISGCGDFQLSQVVFENDPNPLKQSKKAEPMETLKIIKANPAKQTQLDSEIILDPLNTDQPEIDENVKLPEGTSEYQASWLIDDDYEDEDEEEESDESESAEDVNENTLHDKTENGFCAQMEDENYGEGDFHSVVESTTMDETIDFNDADVNDDHQKELFKKERENRQWPDEVEAPEGINTRDRFKRYRGLKSFRTSPWDPKENLTRDYARIYKIVNFKRTRKLALEAAKQSFHAVEEGDEQYCSPGAYVTLYISSTHSPLIVFGLLKNEHRMSTLNMILHRYPSFNLPVKNKEELLFQVGCRLFTANPVFSQHTNGQKFKMERFMPSSGAFCATVFAPITFPPSNVLVFRQCSPEKLQLIAKGIVLDSNPDRIILKRVRLSGHPFKVNKRTAVVRYMFFNREDIEWFKPVELYTHSGRHGRIKQAVGTHGLMKCVFDRPLSVQDSVLMNLYKRVFPKWTYNAEVRGRQFCISDEVDNQCEEECTGRKDKIRWDEFMDDE
uniref:Pre-rRNA-processing protein TSR1 homolog n=1 Tax=Meloidogyne hapla TaxID=6305 RepID=A0A1I8C088_MELHA